MSLWIRFASWDNGLRPAAGTPWPYPDAWYLSPDLEPTAGGAAVNRINPNRQYGVRVRVRNNGSNPVANVTVQVWACLYGMAAVVPAIRSWTLTGTVPAATAAGPGVGVFDSPVAEQWTSPANSAHVCLLANCFASGDGSAVGAPTDLDVVHVRRHAQRNLAYAIWPPRPKSHSLVLWSATLAKKRHSYALELIGARGRLPSAEFHDLLSSPMVQALAKHQHRGKRRKDTPIMPVEFAPIAIRAPKLKAGKKTGGLRRPLLVEPGPDRPTRVELTYRLPAVKVPGWQVFDVVQREPEDGTAVGGARLVVLVLPEDVIAALDEREGDGTG